MDPCTYRLGDPVRRSAWSLCEPGTANKLAHGRPNPFSPVGAALFLAMRDQCRRPPPQARH